MKRSEKFRIISQETERLINEFCKLNKIKAPKISYEFKDKLGGTTYYSETKNLGYYQIYSKTIHVIFGNSELNSEKSFIAGLEDNTIHGTLLHEFGHFVRFNTNIDWDSFPNGIRTISNYERRSKDWDETVAETFRLYIGNPHLLSIWNPARFKWMSEHFKRVRNTSWDKTLFNLGVRQDRIKSLKILLKKKNLI